MLQLVAYGAQDVYITGNPQVTFFKLVYRRHTNFSMETIEQTFNGNPDFGKKVTCTLSRNGDLIHKIWLYVTLTEVKVKQGTQFRWLNWLGHLMISYVEFEIGGQKIDKQYGEWMQIYCELTMKAGHSSGYANMVGNSPALTNMRQPTAAQTLVVPECTLYVPLQFYFCRNPGLAVPLVALQYHEVKINIEFRPLEECVHSVETTNFSYVIPEAKMKSASLLVDYIFLDSDERRRFAQISHEYLITQLQFTGEESIVTSGTAVNPTYHKLRLAFNHPTKEIVWVSVKDQFTHSAAADGPSTGRQWFNFTTKVDTTYLTGTSLDNFGGGIGFGGDVFQDLALKTTKSAAAPGGSAKSGTAFDLFTFDTDIGENPTKSAKLVLNGHDRFAERDGRWFNLAVPYATHENIPSTGINVYAFGLRPEEHQPSGSINFSRIDTANLHVSLLPEAGKDGCKLKIYAVSYNILRIMSGMGGLAYSN